MGTTNKKLKLEKGARQLKLRSCYNKSQRESDYIDALRHTYKLEYD
jgi:hypothetical protein